MRIPIENQLSIRALHAIGIVLFVRYCHSNRITHAYIAEFVDHMWGLCNAASIPEWDRAVSRLRVAGLGEPLPSEIIAAYPRQSATLAAAVDCLREITAVQIFGAYQPNESLRCLEGLMRVTGVNMTDEGIQVFASSTPNENGWGTKVDEQLLNRWKAIAAS